MDGQKSLRNTVRCIRPACSRTVINPSYIVQPEAPVCSQLTVPTTGGMAENAGRENVGQGHEIATYLSILRFLLRQAAAGLVVQMVQLMEH